MECQILAFSKFFPFIIFCQFFRFIDKLSLGGVFLYTIAYLKNFPEKIFGFLKIGS